MLNSRRRSPLINFYRSHIPKFYLCRSWHLSLNKSLLFLHLFFRRFELNLEYGILTTYPSLLGLKASWVIKNSRIWGWFVDTKLSDFTLSQNTHTQSVHFQLNFSKLTYHEQISQVQCVKTYDIIIYSDFVPTIFIFLNGRRRLQKYSEHPLFM